MLTRILTVEGIGLLHQASGAKGTRLEKRTLLYAENGRGKSTLASILTACANKDPRPIRDRVTIDGTVSPHVSLVFDTRQVEFKSGNWSGINDDILVYDATFVNENVYSGPEVTTNQRANLLDFALGTKAVQARSDEQTATRGEQAANQELKKLNQHLDSILAGRVHAATFRALPPDPDIDKRIIEADQRLNAQRRSAEITRLPIPEIISLPEVDFDSVYQIINRTLENIHADAKARVTAHLEHLIDPNAGPWVQQGMKIIYDNNCPFCGQDTTGVELLELYRVYFDQAYDDLNKSMESMFEPTLQKTDPNQIADISKYRVRNNQRIETWREYVPIAPLGGERDELATATLVNLQDLLRALFARKTASIADAHAGPEDLAELKRLWNQFSTVYEDENTVIRANQQQIEQHKATLDSEDAEVLKQSLESLELIKLRYEARTIELIQKIKDTEDALKNAEQVKKSARDNLNAVMRDTLADFKDSINNHLADFGTNFKISELRHSYRGATPRTEYQIMLRGRSIELNGGLPTFATALSEGDKRTMGFAFFAASVLADKEVSKKIVVIDDPMSSLDSSRRDHTLKVIERISEESAQVIIMAHDEHFLRDVRERLHRNDGTTQIAELSLRMSTSGYSDFADLNLDNMCQSDYLKHYRLVSAVTSGELNSPDQIADAAIALRLLIEGYLHRKYPDAITSGCMLGNAITEIEKAKDSDSPLAAMAMHIDKLRDINSYASQFHHNAQPDLKAARKVPHSEIVTRGTQVLDFIHSA